jgi:hypothetical protein
MLLPLPAILPMDVQQQALVQLKGEQRIKSGTDIDTVETELNPTLRYDFIWRGGQNHFVALYVPRYLYTSNSNVQRPDPKLVNPGSLRNDYEDYVRNPNRDPFSALHNGGFGFEMTRQRWRLSLYQLGAYGTISTTALLVPPVWEGAGPPADPQPIIPSIIGARFTLVFVQTQLFVPIRLSPRTALIPGATYNVFGGADRESLGVIARTSGPGATLALEHAATHSDTLISTVGVGQVTTTFQDERDNVLILRSEASQVWRHYYSKSISSDLMAGAAIGGDAINGFTIYTLGHASVLYDSWPLVRIPPGAAPYGGPPGHGHRLQVGAIAKVAPWIDLFSGDLEQRFVLSVAANYTIDRLTFRGQLSQARVVNTPQTFKAQYQIVFGDLGLRFRLTPTLWADGGARFGYQDFNNAVRFNQLTQTQFYAGLTWAPLPARF